MFRLLTFVVSLMAASSCASVKPSAVSSPKESRPTSQPLPVTPVKEAVGTKKVETPKPAPLSSTGGIPHWAENQTVFQDALNYVAKENNVRSKKPLISTLALFDVEKYTLPTLVEQEVSALVEMLKMNPSNKVILSGHTDSDESSAAGDKTNSLKELRVSAIASELKTRGVYSDQISSTLRETPAIEKGSRNQRLFRAVVAELDLK